MKTLLFSLLLFNMGLINTAYSVDADRQVCIFDTEIAGSEQNEQEKTEKEDHDLGRVECWEHD